MRHKIFIITAMIFISSLWGTNLNDDLIGEMNDAKDINKLIPNYLEKEVPFHVIKLINGDTISGTILSEDDTLVIIKTQYGTIEINKDKIESIEKVDNNIKGNFKKNINKELNQEARWRTIWAGMTIANTLYGIGIPYVLDFNEGSVAGGFRLITFGASFYGMYNYTANMEIPYGRFQFQLSGAQLGGASILPIMAVIGWDNVDEINPRVWWIYEMIAIPMSLKAADKLYYKWHLTNGQASLVSASTNLGAINTVLLLNLIYEDGWEDETLNKFYVPLTYLGAIGTGYLTKNYVSNKSYTEDDAVFIEISSIIGFTNFLFLGNLLDIEDAKINQLLLLTSVNGFTYLADKINKNHDLKRGQARIIGLGTFASLMAWNGIALLMDVDDKNMYLLGDMISVSAGWFFTHKKISSSNYSSNIGFNKFLNKVSIKPTFALYGKNIQPQIQLKINF